MTGHLQLVLTAFMTSRRTFQVYCEQYETLRFKVSTALADDSVYIVEGVSYNQDLTQSMGLKWVRATQRCQLERRKGRQIVTGSRENISCDGMNCGCIQEVGNLAILTGHQVS